MNLAQETAFHITPNRSMELVSPETKEQAPFREGWGNIELNCRSAQFYLKVQENQHQVLLAVVNSA